MFGLISWERNKVWHWTLAIERVLNTEHFYGKNHAENVCQILAPDHFLILPNYQK